MKRLICFVLMVMMAARPATAQAPVEPDVALAPEDVISIQLKALSVAQNDPATNSGIARVWAFAHPANRAVTGPLPRFVAMLQSSRYRPLIGHRAHHLREISQTADAAHYAVRVTADDGAVYGYSWQLGKVAAGAYKDMWMTTGVALVGKLGQAL